jgi:hypothetical protein
MDAIAPTARDESPYAKYKKPPRKIVCGICGEDADPHRYRYSALFNGIRIPACTVCREWLWDRRDDVADSKKALTAALGLTGSNSPA